jgi:hypothetical protein
MRPLTWAFAPIKIVGSVEVPGIEPGSSGVSSRLLRAHPAAVFSAPTVAQAPRRRPSHCLFSLEAP